MPYWTQETASPDAELALDDEDLPYLGLSTLYHPWPASAAPPVFVCRSKEVQIVRNHGNTYNSDAAITPPWIRAQLAAPDLDRDEDLRYLGLSTPSPSLTASAALAACFVHSADKKVSSNTSSLTAKRRSKPAILFDLIHAFPQEMWP